MRRSPEVLLRRLSVRQRMTAIIALLLLPLAVLSAVSMTVLNEQEIAFRDSVEESVHGLLPLSTLEYYLQQALVDELLAESHDSVPDFAALTQSIDSSFSSIQLGPDSKDVPKGDLDDAQKTWLQARPSVRRLIEQVHAQHLSGAVASLNTRTELERAIRDIASARVSLSGALKARYEAAAAQRTSQLHWLMWSWLITLTVAGVLIVIFLRSLLRPLQALTQAARRIEEGHAGVRVDVDGWDELAVLTACFNRMTANWEITQSHLQTEAIKDPLTGVLNRRGILSQLDAELELHRLRQQPLSVLAMDLDHFKFINDHYGHSTGDRALTWVASTMRGLLRENDHLGRHGGDEFIAVLPNTNHASALEIASRISELVREGAAREAAYPEISIGVATAPEDGGQAASLLEAADARLYAQKRHRRTTGDADRQEGHDGGR
ncbi:MAG: sensor domain-containing diguanylate cyclase [Rhodanobacter sp.]|nr:MAG: sensor domain-containing diguanylate cyclase [Rhodanobacter sp.]TAL97587.1 MAG: sensor domain-containing diguanylate cyclase [Rhodanobacter sp.]TAM39547.1 MAG: sensor domain-containing diguanylate cyclase [Rhodanobacter sp.]TAN22860.1 MAG: sensor domain-containing diguanylate cyclase [Rhodanobacter sp.]